MIEQQQELEGLEQRESQTRNKFGCGFLLTFCSLSVGGVGVLQN